MASRHQRRRKRIAAQETAEPEEEAEPETIDLGGIYRVEGTNPSGSKYRGMVALAQNDDQFNFTWWIGKDVFRGIGALRRQDAGGQLGRQDPGHLHLRR